MIARLAQVTLILVCTFLTAFAVGQNVEGLVRDKDTKKPLAFVNIVELNNRQGTSTDIDGKFILPSDHPIKTIQLSYVGYETLEYDVTGPTVIIDLVPNAIVLEEFEVLPGENPAHRIINNAVANRKLNNPEKSSSFKLDTYNKFVFSLDMSGGQQDSTAKQGGGLVRVEVVEDTTNNASDDADFELANFAKNHDLLVMESLTERKFLPPNNNYEKVKASKVSGFKNPTFATLATQMQPFSFYETYISILDVQYLNPISTGSTKRYLFNLEDTVYTGQDSVFIISFRPKRGKNFVGMKGLLYINTNRWGVQNVIAEPAEVTAGSFNVSIQQKYEFIDGKQWFPVQLNTDIQVYGISVGQASIKGVGRSYLRNIELNPELKRNEFSNIEIDFAENAGEQASELLEGQRKDTLTTREKNTYAYVDSLSEANDLETRIKLVQSLATGQLPIGPVDLDVYSLLRFNGFEGARVGLGLHTNSKISSVFRIGGYAAYGFKDKTSKYGGDLNIKINRIKQIELNVSYSYDVFEVGRAQYYGSARLDLNDSYRLIDFTRFDYNTKWESYLGFRALRHFKFHAFGNRQFRASTDQAYNYLAVENGELTPSPRNYVFTETGLGFRFGFKEKFMQTPNGLISLGTKYPVVHGKITRGLEGVLDGEFDYWKVEGRVEKSYKIKNFGRSGFEVNGAYVSEALPATALYNPVSNFGNIRKGISTSFATVQPNEFISSRFASITYYHTFENLLINTEKFKPEFVLVTRFAVGDLLAKNQHVREDGFKTLENGLAESGLEINNLHSFGATQLGLSVFYRYGANHLPELKDNVSVNLTLGFPFSFN